MVRQDRDRITHCVLYFHTSIQKNTFHRETGKGQNRKESEFFFSKLESVRIGKCQNQKESELENVRIGKCPNWKVSESERVRIGKCQIWKVSESERVRIGKCQIWKVSELESVRVGKCQNYLEC